MNIIKQLEAGNVGAVISKLEELFEQDVVAPAEPVIADVESAINVASQIATLLNGLLNSFSPVTTNGTTVVTVAQPAAGNGSASSPQEGS